MLKKLLLVGSFILSSITFVNASAISGLSVGGGVGLLGGVNMQLGYRFPSSDSFIKNRLGFRLDYNTWSPIKDTVNTSLSQFVKIDGNKFDPSVDGYNFGALVDFYPFGSVLGLGNIRLVAGYYFGKFDLGGTLHKDVTGQTFNIGGINYSLSAGSEMLLTAMLKNKVRGPYLGLGFDVSLLLGLKFYFDAGTVFIPAPDITTSVSGHGTLMVGGVPSINLTNNSGVNQLLNDTMDNYKSALGNIKNYYPMVKFGLLYRF